MSQQKQWGVAPDFADANGFKSAVSLRSGSDPGAGASDIKKHRQKVRHSSDGVILKKRISFPDHGEWNALLAVFRASSAITIATIPRAIAAAPMATMMIPEPSVAPIWPRAPFSPITSKP